MTKDELRSFDRCVRNADKVMLKHEEVAVPVSSSYVGHQPDTTIIASNGIYSTDSLYDWDEVEKANEESLQ